MNALIFIQTDEDQILRSSIETICGLQKVLTDSNDGITTISFNSAVNEQLNNYKITDNYFIDNDDHMMDFNDDLIDSINSFILSLN